MLYLLYKNILSFITRHRLVFSLFCVSQVVSILSVLFMYGLFASAQNQEAQYKDGVRTFIATPFDAPDSAARDAVLSIAREKKKELSSLSAFLEQGTVRANVLYSPSWAEQTISYGHYFNEKDFEEGRRQVVICSLLNAEKMGVPSSAMPTVAGDWMPLLGASYQVVGFSDIADKCHEIPFSSLNDFSNIENVTLVLEKTPTEKELGEWLRYLQKKFPSWEVQAPKAPNIKARMQEKSQLFTAAAVGLIAVLNFSFLYSYLLQKRKPAYAVLRMCGCGKAKGFWLFALENLLLSSTLFLACSLFFHFCLSKVYQTVSTHMLYGMGISDFLSLYAVYLSAILLVFGGTLLRFSRQSPHALYQEV